MPPRSPLDNRSSGGEGEEEDDGLGGSSGGGDKTLREMVVVNAQAWCFGSVDEYVQCCAKECIPGSDSCGIVTHQKDKMRLTVGYAYIFADVKKTRLLSHPTQDMFNVPDVVAAFLVGEARPLEMQRMFLTSLPSEEERG